MRRHTLLEVVGRRVDELEGNELEPTLLEAADDVANESTLDTVGLKPARVNIYLSSTGMGEAAVHAP